MALKKQCGRIKQSAILAEPSLGGLLYSSFGQTRIDVARIFAAGLVRQGHIPSSRGFDNNSIFAIDPRPERYGMHSEIWQGSAIGLTLLYAQLGVYHGVRFRSSTPTYRSPRHDTSRIDLPMQRVSHFPVGGPYPGLATSMSINESCRQLAVTWLSDDRTHLNRARIYRLTNTNVDDFLLPENIIECPAPASPPGESFTTGDVFCSAAAPTQSPLRFAFGTKSRILTLGKETRILSTVRQSSYGSRELKDILALEFQDQNTLLAGNRRGKLYITDLRDPRFDSTASIIHHPSTITHIQTLDAHRILVAGLNSTLSQYDLRFTKADTSFHPQRKNSRNNILQTRPILVYDYHNSATINIGLDVDLESGLIAAAQEYSPHHSTVQLFSLHGGHQLRSPAMDKEFGPAILRTRRAEEREMLPVRCVRFARDVEERMSSLYIGASQGLVRYAWAENEEVQEAVLRFPG